MFLRSLFFSSLIASTAMGHHGLDFMVLQDGTIPDKGSLIAFSNSTWSLDGAQEYTVEPGFNLGLTPWLAVGTGASISDEGDGWNYMSTSPYLTLALLRSERIPWLRVSLFAGYEIPTEGYQQASFIFTPPAELTGPLNVEGSTKTTTISSSKSSSHSHSSVERSPRHGEGNTGGGGPDGGGSDTHSHSAGSTTTTTVTTGPSRADIRRAEKNREQALKQAKREALAAYRRNQPYRGIHRHGEEGWIGRLIIDIDLSDKDRLLLNLINFTPRRGEPAWGYGIGYRHAFSHDLATSIEATGDLDDRGSHEALAAVHWAVNHHAVLKLGLGTGLTDNSPGKSLYAGVVWRF